MLIYIQIQNMNGNDILPYWPPELKISVQLNRIKPIPTCHTK